MSEARELYLAAQRQGVFSRPGEVEAHRSLTEAANLWRNEGRHFSAGYAMSWAVRSAWGNPGQMMADQRIAANDFQRAVNTNPPDSFEALAALYKLQGELAQLLWLFGSKAARVKGIIRELDEE